MSNSKPGDVLPRAVLCRANRRIPASADQVWGVVGDLGSAVIGGGMIERVEIRGSGAGAVRRLVLAGGAAVEEVIEEYDADQRRYTYRMLDGGPLPMCRYLGVAEVFAAGPEGSILSWSAAADPVEIDFEALRAMLQHNLDTAVGSVAAHFGAS